MNNENLKRLSPSEAREFGRMGGKKSGEVRRRKADFRKTLNMLLTAEINSEEYGPVLQALGVESTLESAMLMSMIKAALEGDVKAAYFVAQYAGQSGQTEADEEEQKARIGQMKANTARIQKDVSPGEDEGVEIINDAPEKTGANIGDSDSKVPADI